MRVLHVATARTWRGGEQQVFYLLSGLRRRGLEPVLATPGESPLANRVRESGGTVLDWSAHGDLDLVAAQRLRGIIKGGFEIVHLHTARAHALGLLAAWGLKPRPRLVVSRRVDFRPARTPWNRLKYGPRVDRFVAVSNAVARILLEAGVEASRIVTVHSGVDPARFAGPREGEAFRRELGVPADAKLVGFVGALVAHKAPADFLDALARVPADVHGVLAGDGPLARSLRHRARRLGVEDRTHFLGHRGDVPRILRSVDLFCLPSHMEGLGTSVLDAMAAGTPVVAAAGGGIAEMVEDGVSGLLVPPGEVDALARAWSAVLNDPERAARLAEGGRRRVERFTAERMVEGTLEVYRALVRGGSQGDDGERTG